MITILAGSRDLITYSDMQIAIWMSGISPSMVISGTARGADRLGEQWAYEHGVPVKRFPADWDKYGKSAGYKRNEEMAKNAEALIAVQVNKSKGTQHMINIAEREGLTVFKFEITR